MDKRNKTMEDVATNMVAELILRIIYFFIGLFAPPTLVLIFTPRHSVGRSIWSQPELLSTLAVVSVVSAILSTLVGPYLYQKHTQRGRGDLESVRRASQSRLDDE